MTRDGRATVERHVFPHDRDGNKRAAALAALDLVGRLAHEG
jgi:prophage maintenance system killer protein